jgi:flagellar biosynthetic protein FliP
VSAAHTPTAGRGARALRRGGLALLAGTASAAACAAARAAAPLSVQLAGAGGGADTSSALRIFLTLTALSFIPAALICMTSFVRIVVVLSMLRHAIGLTDTPPNMVIVALSLFLTLFSMSPVLERVNTQALQPYLDNQLAPGAALERAKAPVRDFMIRQTRERDLMLMVDIAKAQRPKTVEDVNLVHLAPAFMLSELRSAFQIGFVIYLPFLLIDLVVSSVLMALGMMMVPPTTISIPMKILLFVLIDGWNIVVKALLETFH